MFSLALVDRLPRNREQIAAVPTTLTRLDNQFFLDEFFNRLVKLIFGCPASIMRNFPHKTQVAVVSGVVLSTDVDQCFHSSRR